MAINGQKGFDFSLVINDIDSVKPRESGRSEIDGQEITWGHAVKFKTRNIELREDEEFGIKEVETTLEIEIPCDTKQELIELNKFMLGLKTDKKQFPIQTTLPGGSSTEKSAKSLLKAKEFMAQLKK